MSSSSSSSSSRTETCNVSDIEFLSHCPSSLAAAAIIRAAEDVADLALIDAGIAVSWCTGLTEVISKLIFHAEDKSSLLLANGEWCWEEAMRCLCMFS